MTKRGKRSAKQRHSQAGHGTGSIEQGIAAHRQGDLDQAKSIYRRILDRQPHRADAMHLLGFAEFQSGQLPAAIKLLQAAVEADPANAEYRNNLALACLASGDLDKGREHCRSGLKLGHRDGQGYLHVAIELFMNDRLALAEAAVELGLLIQADMPEAYNYLGIIRAAQNDFNGAIQKYRYAIGLKSDYAEAWNNLGNAYRDSHRVSEAIPCYERAIRLHPPFAAAHNNLGLALANSGDARAAVGHYERAIELDPQFFQAWNNLGSVQADEGNHSQAIECYLRAIALNPRSAETYTNLGVAFRRVGQTREAVTCFRRAIILNPNSAKIYAQLAFAYADAGDDVLAARCCEQASRLDPDQPLWRLVSASIVPVVFGDLAEMDQCWQRLSNVVSELNDNSPEFDFRDVEGIATGCPFNLQYFENDLRPLKESYARIFSHAWERFGPRDVTRRTRLSRGRRRIGLVVTDGHEPIFLKSLRGVIERINHQEFELLVIASSRTAAIVRSNISCDHVQVVPTSGRIERVAKAIEDVACDLLYYWEIGTDVTNYFLPFQRLAPIQVTSWGVQVTSGIPNVDYYLSSALVEPDDAPSHYSEQLVLAKTLLTYRSRSELVNPLPREYFNIPPAARWYVCPQQPGKFHIDFDSMLESILRHDDHGVVVITGDASGAGARALRDRFQKRLADVADRIVLLPRLENRVYLSLIRNADVLLDPPHFGGVNTTYDCLSLGKVIVTLPSRFHRARYTFGCYQKMGLMDFVARDREEYVKLAVDLACDSDYRIAAEEKIGDASAVLFEDLEAVHEHERIFRELIETARRDPETVLRCERP